MVTTSSNSMLNEWKSNIRNSKFRCSGARKLRFIGAKNPTAWAPFSCTRLRFLFMKEVALLSSFIGTNVNINLYKTTNREFLLVGRGFGWNKSTGEITLCTV